MRKDDLLRVRHMLDAVHNAMRFAEGKSRSDLDRNLMLTFTASKKASADCFYENVGVILD